MGVIGAGSSRAARCPGALARTGRGMAGKLLAYEDMSTVLVDSRIERSQSLRDAFERILGTFAMTTTCAPTFSAQRGTP